MVPGCPKEKLKSTPRVSYIGLLTQKQTHDFYLRNSGFSRELYWARFPLTVKKTPLTESTFPFPPYSMRI